jgi:hypothetical protein
MKLACDGHLLKCQQVSSPAQLWQLDGLTSETGSVCLICARRLLVARLLRREEHAADKHHVQE